jgi:hypothetical protein
MAQQLNADQNYSESDDYRWCDTVLRADLKALAPDEAAWTSRPEEMRRVYFCLAAAGLNINQIKALNRSDRSAWVHGHGGGLSVQVSKMIYDKNPHVRVLIDCAMYTYHNRHDWWRKPSPNASWVLTSSGLDCVNIHGFHSYEGELKDGKYHGFGKLTNQMGSVYIGEFCDNKKQGFGKQYGETTFNTATYEIPPKTECDEPGRLEYEGEWYNNKKNGCGFIIWPDGSSGWTEWHDDHIVLNNNKCSCDRVPPNKPYCEERGWVWGWPKFHSTFASPACTWGIPTWIHKSLAPISASALGIRAGEDEGLSAGGADCWCGCRGEEWSNDDDSAESEEEVDTGLIECTRLERGDAVAEPSAPSLCEDTPYDVIPEFFQNINPVEPSAPPMEKIDSFECIICLEHMGENLATTMCGHVFHNQCIQQCLSKSKRCPICNNGVNSVIKLFINVES